MVCRDAGNPFKGGNTNTICSCSARDLKRVAISNIDVLYEVGDRLCQRTKRTVNLFVILKEGWRRIHSIPKSTGGRIIDRIDRNRESSIIDRIDVITTRCSIIYRSKGNDGRPKVIGSWRKCEIPVIVYGGLPTKKTGVGVAHTTDSHSLTVFVRNCGARYNKITKATGRIFIDRGGSIYLGRIIYSGDGNCICGQSAAKSGARAIVRCI